MYACYASFTQKELQNCGMWIHYFTQMDTFSRKWVFPLVESRSITVHCIVIIVLAVQLQYMIVLPVFCIIKCYIHLYRKRVSRYI